MQVARPASIVHRALAQQEGSAPAVKLCKPAVNNLLSMLVTGGDQVGLATDLDSSNVFAVQNLLSRALCGVTDLHQSE